ncbi:MAG TPA: asparagine synthase-related protein [Allosphingosinicella sp.]|jgi:asparagine synthase (glutamine-hydrolysing)
MSPAGPALCDVAGSRKTAQPNADFALVYDPEAGIVSATGECHRRGDRMLFLSGYTGNRSPHEELLDAYASEGAAFTSRVPGQYAGVLVDAGRQCLIAFQDSFGVRTLYYSRRAAIWTFASDPVHARSAEAPLDPDHAAFYLLGTPDFGGSTFFAGVRRLTLGQVLILNRRGSSLRRIYIPPRRTDQAPAAREQERLARLVDDAVVRALEPDRPHLCLFSGGLDSTTVLAFARRRAKVAALTIADSHGENGDDEAFAAPAAAELGVEHLTIDKQLHPPLSLTASPPRPLPGKELNLALHERLQRIVAERGFPVLLTGIGGDQVFGVRDDRHYGLADSLLSLRLRRFVEDCRRASAASPQALHWSRFAAGYAIPAALRWLTGARVAARPPAMQAPDWIAPALVRRARKGRRAGASPFPRIAPPGVQHVWEELFAVCHNAAAGALVFDGCETRHPLLDRPLAEHLLPIDAGRNTRHREDRSLQREALENILPEPVRRRATKGGGTAFQERALLHDSELVAMLTERPILGRLGWIDTGRWRAAVERARFGLFSNLGAFQTTICLEIWLQQREAAGERIFASEG